jgi:hypothetical protein
MYLSGYQLNSLANFLIGVPLNVILLKLIWRKTPGGLRSYARVLVIVCVNDLISLTSGVAAMPVAINYAGETFLVNVGPSLLVDSRQLNFLLATVWVMSRQFIQDSIPFQFIHRYHVLRSGRETSLRHFVLIYTFPVLASIGVAVLSWCVYAIIDEPTFADAEREVPWEAFGVTKTHILVVFSNAVGVISWLGDGMVMEGDSESNPRPQLGVQRLRTHPNHPRLHHIRGVHSGNSPPSACQLLPG